MVDSITEREQRFRDRLLEPFVDALIPESVHPNHLTLLRFFLVGTLVVMFLLGSPLLIQLIVVGLAAVTDTVDGVMARTRNQITPWGSLMDHVADWMLGMWVGVLALVHGVLDRTLIALMIFPHLVLGLVNWGRVSDKRSGPGGVRLVFHAFALEDFEASVVARVEFVFVLAGLIFLLLAEAVNDTLVRGVGRFFIYAMIASAFFLAGRATYRTVAGLGKGSRR